MSQWNRLGKEVRPARRTSVENCCVVSCIVDGSDCFGLGPSHDTPTQFNVKGFLLETQDGATEIDATLQ